MTRLAECSKAVPAIILTVIALAQIALARSTDLTAWKGGGFGMFSTLDHGAFRYVDVLIDGPERSEALDIPPSLETAAARAAACPSDWLLRALAEGVVAREKRYERPVSRITITVLRTAFDPATLNASEQPIRTFVYDVPPR